MACLCSSMQVQEYRFLEGMEELLLRLSNSSIEMHIMSNYTDW